MYKKNSGVSKENDSIMKKVRAVKNLIEDFNNCYIFERKNIIMYVHFPKR